MKKVRDLNIGIVGSSGSGKTQTIKQILYNISTKTNADGSKPKALIIDYNGDFSSDNDFVKKTNARIVEPYELPLNIFSISDEIINEGGKKLNKEKINKLTFLQDVLGTIILRWGMFKNQI